MTKSVPTPVSPLRLKGMKLRPYPPKTIDTYVGWIIRLARFFGVCPSRLTVEDIHDFQLYLVDELELSYSSHNVAVCAIRYFYRCILDRHDVIERVRCARRAQILPTVLSRGEVQAVLAAAPDHRSHTMFALAYGTGLRMSELRHVEISSIDAERKMLHVRRAKRRKERLAPLSDRLIHLLRRWWCVEKPQRWLFQGLTPDQPISERRVQRAIRKAVEWSRIRKQATMHTLRHSFATHHLEAGTDLLTLQALLGHSRLSTTAIYARVTLKNVQREGSPLDLIEGI